MSLRPDCDDKIAGSQGEPMAAPSRMANGDHKIQIEPGDTAVLASLISPVTRPARSASLTRLRSWAPTWHKGNEGSRFRHAAAGESCCTATQHSLGFCRRTLCRFTVRSATRLPAVTWRWRPAFRKKNAALRVRHRRHVDLRDGVAVCGGREAPRVPVRWDKPLLSVRGYRERPEDRRIRVKRASCLSWTAADRATKRVVGDRSGYSRFRNAEDDLSLICIVPKISLPPGDVSVPRT